MTIEYDDFDELYPGKLDEEVFDGLLPSASMYLNVITHNRVDSALGWARERAKYALANVIIEMAAAQAELGQNGAHVSSVSNDGYSETYQTGGEGERIRHAAFFWLSGTGLVSAL